MLNSHHYILFGCIYKCSGLPLGLANLEKRCPRMKKLLILSDIHYPAPHSEEFARIIKTEKPDNVVLLGDNVEGGKDGKLLAKRYRDFLAEFSKVFDIRKTAILLGDNDRMDHGRVSKMIMEANPMNAGSPLTLRLGNMFFFHGNLESYRFEEIVGFVLGNALMAIDERIMTKLLAALVRRRFGLDKEDYLFLGHLHFLGVLGQDVFCGTLSHRRVLNRIRKDLPCMGYVTVTHDNFRIVKRSKIEAHQLRMRAGRAYIEDQRLLK